MIIIRLLYQIGPLKFWLCRADTWDIVAGPGVYNLEGQRIGQLIVEEMPNGDVK